MTQLNCKNWCLSRSVIFLLLGICLTVWGPAQLSAAPLKQVEIAVKAHNGIEVARDSSEIKEKTIIGVSEKTGQWLLLFIVFAGGFFLAILYKKRKLKTLIAEKTKDLQFEKDNFLNIFNTMKDGVYIVDDQYNIKFLNNIIKKELGDIRGRKCFAYFHDREEPCSWCRNAEVFEGKIVRWEWHSFRNKRDYDLIESPLSNPDGSISKLVIYRDITEVKQVRNRLEQSENRLSSIFRVAPAGIGLIIDRVIQEVNERFCEMLDYTKEELLGRSASMVYPDDEEYEYVGREKYKQISEQGTGTVETRLRRKDGKIIDVLLSSTPLDLNDLAAGVTFIATDISNIKNTEGKLRRSEIKFRSMMESMGDPVYICSDDFRVEYMNPAMIERTGRDATGEFCYQALHDFDEPCPWCTSKKESHGKYFESEVVSPKDNHSYHVSHSPIAKEDGSVSSLVIFRDTTKFKKMEAQLLQSQKMESVGNLAGGVAHDFNNILTAISGYSEMALDNLEEGSAVRQDVKEIQKLGERAADLTRQLLTFSRKQVIMPKTVNINNLINDMRKMFSRLISEDIRLETLLDEQVGAIYADPLQVKQIIFNLVVNAQDAVKKQPEHANKIIQVSTAQVFLDDTCITTHLDSSPGWYLQLRVKDSGCGISKEVLDHVFEPFYTTKSEGVGTGMGLATVYGIVKQNCGRANVYSEPGQGATFEIYWPIKEIEVSEVADQELQPASGGVEVILLAEDDKQVREIASRQLRKAGYTVISASDGREALEKASEYREPVDLLFTDMVMPIMGGKELSEKVKEIYPDMITLFVSGYRDSNIHQEILALGMDRFISKPYNIQDVIIKIRRLLDDKES